MVRLVAVRLATMLGRAGAARAGRGPAASLQAQQRGHGSDGGGQAEADPALRGQVYPMLATILFAVVVLAVLRRWLLARRVG